MSIGAVPAQFTGKLLFENDQLRAVELVKQLRQVLIGCCFTLNVGEEQHPLTIFLAQETP